MQVWVSAKNGQTALLPVPPLTIERERDCVPPLQVWVQLDHTEKVDTTQLMGHVPRLQAIDCDVGPQAAPPPVGVVRTARERALVPAVQLLEHSLHAEYCARMQSTGHGASPQLRDCTSTGAAAPPLAAAVRTARERSCEPPPHVALHVLQLDHSETSLSTAHPCGLHP